MVFYRKYRPQKIDDLDNAQIREILVSILSKDPPHAFLFTGPKGLGKTSTARIIAKAINCENKNQESGVKNQGDKKTKNLKSEIRNLTSDLEPCNTCTQCTSITNGTNLDVIEIDAASNRGIDEIRDLKEKIRLSPISAKKKMYIIDEVHMLTTEAFNALLKTLEEPPDHAVFILCTTELHKLPETIISRCFHLNFHLATEVELVRSFRRIVAGEKIAITDDALRVIANLAEGGFRDGAKLLEELVLVANGEKITEEFIEKKYKVSGIKHQVAEIVAALQERETKRCLEVIGKIVNEGVDLKVFVEGVLRELHEMLLVEVGVNKEKLGIKKQGLGIEEIKKLSESFSKAYGEMKYAVVPQLPLELAVVEYCQLNVIASSEDPSTSSGQAAQPPPLTENAGDRHVFDREAQTESAPSSLAMTSGVTVSSLRKQVGEIKKNQAVSGETVTKKQKQQPVLPKVNLMQVPANGEITKEWVDALWQHLIADMKGHNHTIAGVLRSCRLKTYDGKRIVIETNYTFHKEKLDEPKTKDALADVCKILTGNVVEVEIQLKK